MGDKLFSLGNMRSDIEIHVTLSFPREMPQEANKGFWLSPLALKENNSLDCFEALEQFLV